MLTERERALSEREEKVTRYDMASPTKLNLNTCIITILIKLHCCLTIFERKFTWVYKLKKCIPVSQQSIAWQL